MRSDLSNGDDELVPVVSSGDGAADDVAGTSDAAAASTLLAVRRGVTTCDPSAPVLVHVAKMVYASGVSGAHADDTFIGFARVFSGTLRPGSGGTLHVLRSAASNAAASNAAASSNAAAEEADPLLSVPIDSLRLYILMGRDLIATDTAPAGCVIGIGGLGAAVARSATLCTLATCPTFAEIGLQSAPIVSVALEPRQLGALGELERGLRTLARADWSVEVDQLPSGEHVLRTCGEVHLERCLHDLRTSFAPGIDLVVSSPIVPLRETVASASAPAKSVELATANRQCTLSAHALALPDESLVLLSEHCTALRAALSLGGGSWLGQGSNGHDALETLTSCLHASGKQWAGLVAVAAAPVSTCDNLLLCKPSVAAQLRSGGELRGLLPSVLSGFQLAASSGPLCEEPVSGVAFVLEEIALAEADAANGGGGNGGGGNGGGGDEEEQSSGGGGGGGSAAGQLEGQLIVAMKDACRGAFLACSTRVLEPMYLCELQTSADKMGQAYGTLAKRRAQILSEDMKEGTPIFTIRAHLPVVESFGFATALRKDTSGAAHPQLVFAHYEALPQVGERRTCGARVPGASPRQPSPLLLEAPQLSAVSARHSPPLTTSHRFAPPLPSRPLTRRTRTSRSCRRRSRRRWTTVSTTGSTSRGASSTTCGGARACAWRRRRWRRARSSARCRARSRRLAEPH